MTKRTRIIPEAVLMLLCFPFATFSLAYGTAKAITTKSPDHHLAISVTLSKGKVHYSFSAGATGLISSSAMGLYFAPGRSIPASGWTVGSVTRKSIDSIWKPVWGKCAMVRDRYNETTIGLRGSGAPFDKLLLVIRAYDDGITFRYEVPADAKGDEAACQKELTEFNFAGNYTCWFYNGEHDNLGPNQLTDVDGRRDPVMTIRANDHAYMAVTEAELHTGAPIILDSKKDKTSFAIASSPGIVGPGYKTSWRVLLYGSTPGALVDSHVVQLLNPAPTAGSDFSWVKPGVAVWDWRVNGARVNGFEYKMDYPTWVRLVNFASKNDIPYLVLDAGWYGPEFQKGSNPFLNPKVGDVKRLIDYATGKNVRVWLYLNDVAGRTYPIENVLKQFKQWGVAGIKYGFMRGSMADKNIRTRMITRLCAENHLMCDFHDGPVIPYGQMRSWPNSVTREYCHAQLDAHRVFQPKTFVTSVFVNMLAGPLDMNNGIFGLQTNRRDNSQKVPSTLVSEAARTLIVFSGLTVIPDIPENYEKYPALLSFISAEKMPWKRSKTLAGEIGKYIVMARQSSDGTWLVGAATDESARELDIPLHFLGKGRYEATIIQDGDKADYLTNRFAHKISRLEVHSVDTVHARLMPGGGACLIIRRS